MKRIRIPGTDLDVSAICYGTMDLGHDMVESTLFRLLDIFRDAGGNFLDTAHIYAGWTAAGAGSSERAIARYLRIRGKGDMVIATKGGHPAMPWYPRGDRYLAPARIRADIEESLERLRTGTIDLFYLHRDDTRMGVDEIVDMLDGEIHTGTIRFAGASNWSVERIEAANAYAARTGRAGFVASQVEFSLARADPPKVEPAGSRRVVMQPRDIEFYTSAGIAVCAYSAAARGYFSGGPAKRPDLDTEENRLRLDRARGLAARKGCTPTQIALSWLMRQPFPCIPVMGTVTPERLVENLAAVSVELSPREFQELAGTGYGAT